MAKKNPNAKVHAIKKMGPISWLGSNVRRTSDEEKKQAPAPTAVSKNPFLLLVN